jgi:hypothetical protein
MKNLLAILSVGVLLIAGSVNAHADSMSGTLDIAGHPGSISPVPFSSSTSSITFASGKEFADGTVPDTGGYFNVPDLSNVAFVSTFNFNQTPAGFASALMFTFTQNGSPDSFYATKAVYDALGNIYFYGTLSQDGTAASFEITPNGSENGNFTGTLTVPPVSPTPEPSSLILLGTGLFGAVGVMYRKRRGEIA